jgi:signal transduction histidine kinase
VSGDKVYLKKLFSNIISNAIFYGKQKGMVTIEAKKIKGRAVIAITDNGIGIPKDDVAHIFKRFYRADNARVSNHEGTGLGLAISKWIVEAHDGTIEVSSTYKKGTTFTISIPLLH